MQTEDLIRILALLADYGRTLDEEEWDEHAALWAEDGHLLVFGADHAGREAIVRFMRTAPVGKHITGVPSLDFAGDGARARSDFVFFGKDRRSLYSAGTYLDEFTREAGEWRLSRREIAIALGPGARE